MIDERMDIWSNIFTSQPPD
jgi:hypothetical protein